MDDFDRIEQDRERNEGLVYDEWWERSRALADDNVLEDMCEDCGCFECECDEGPVAA